jgi:imidazoleglycerol phosphate dehydratase HisB
VPAAALPHPLLPFAAPPQLRLRQADIHTGLGFLNHMLHAMAKHGRLNLKLKVTAGRSGSSNTPWSGGQLMCMFVLEHMLHAVAERGRLHLKLKVTACI